MGIYKEIKERMSLEGWDKNKGKSVSEKHEISMACVTKKNKLVEEVCLRLKRP